MNFSFKILLSEKIQIQQKNLLQKNKFFQSATFLCQTMQFEDNLILIFPKYIKIIPKIFVYLFCLLCSKEKLKILQNLESCLSAIRDLRRDNARKLCPYRLYRMMTLRVSSKTLTKIYTIHILVRGLSLLIYSYYYYICESVTAAWQLVGSAAV